MHGIDGLFAAFAFDDHAICFFAIKQDLLSGGASDDIKVFAAADWI